MSFVRDIRLVIRRDGTCVCVCVCLCVFLLCRFTLYMCSASFVCDASSNIVPYFFDQTPPSNSSRIRLIAALQNQIR